MRTRIFGSLSIALLVLSACGSSDSGADSADSDAATDTSIDTPTDTVAGVAPTVADEPASDDGDGSPQDEVADMMVDEMAKENMVIDRDCARDAASKLSDEDAQKIVDAGVEGDPDVSDEAMSAADDMVDCIDTDQLVDQIITNMQDSVGAENVDADCMKDALKDLDLANMDDDGGDMATAMTECVDLDG